MATEKQNCPTCATQVSATTLQKFGGVCRRCHKQPIGLKQQWMFFAVITLAIPFVAYLTDQELVAIEESGDSRRVHIILAMGYKVGGRLGVAIIFCLIGVTTAFCFIKTFRKALELKRLTKDMPKN